jgi:hypothetical protein
MNDRSGPEAAPESLATARPLDADIVSQTADIVPLPHQLVAVLVRDTDAGSIARRRLKRTRQLVAEQRQAQEQWIDEQYGTAS